MRGALGEGAFGPPGEGGLWTAFPHLCLPWLQLFSKLQAVKAEIHDLQEEHIKERQELEQTQNELTRELKLK